MSKSNFGLTHLRLSVLEYAWLLKQRLIRPHVTLDTSEALSRYNCLSKYLHGSK